MKWDWIERVEPAWRQMRTDFFKRNLPGGRQARIERVERMGMDFWGNLPGSRQARILKGNLPGGRQALIERVERMGTDFLGNLPGGRQVLNFFDVDKFQFFSIM